MIRSILRAKHQKTESCSLQAHAMERSRKAKTLAFRLQASASVPLARKVLQDLLSPANAKESESDHKRPQGQMHQSRLTASDQVSEASPALRGPRHSPRAFNRARRPLQRMMCRSRATESSRNRKDNQQCDSASFSKLTKPVSPADWRILYIL